MITKICRLLSLLLLCKVFLTNSLFFLFGEISAGGVVGIKALIEEYESLTSRVSGWPSGLRRCVQVAVSPGGVGSNPTPDKLAF